MGLTLVPPSAQLGQVLRSDSTYRFRDATIGPQLSRLKGLTPHTPLVSHLHWSTFEVIRCRHMSGHGSTAVTAQVEL